MTPLRSKRSHSCPIWNANVLRGELWECLDRRKRSSCCVTRVSKMSPSECEITDPMFSFWSIYSSVSNITFLYNHCLPSVDMVNLTETAARSNGKAAMTVWHSIRPTFSSYLHHSLRSDTSIPGNYYRSTLEVI